MQAIYSATMANHHAHTLTPVRPASDGPAASSVQAAPNLALMTSFNFGKIMSLVSPLTVSKMPNEA